MYKKYLIMILLILLVFILHQSLLINLNWQFNFWPVILTFILFIFKEKVALIWVVGVGYLLDNFAYIPFGINLVILFCMIGVVYFLMKRLLTNRSILSFLILTLIATLIYDGLFLLLSSFAINLADLQSIIRLSWSTILWQILANLILGVILFLITFKFTKRLQTDLISRRYGV